MDEKQQSTGTQIALLKQSVDTLTATVAELRLDVKSNNALYATKLELQGTREAMNEKLAVNAREIARVDGRYSKAAGIVGAIFVGVSIAAVIAAIKILGPHL